MERSIKRIIAIFTQYGDVLFDGVLMTLKLSVVTVFLGLVFGTLVAFLKMNNRKIGKFRPISFLATVYIEVLRGTPLLLQLYFFFFVVAGWIPALNDKILCCIVALTVNSSAYVAEIVRSGIMAVDPGQTEAARCLGLNKRQTMQKIVIPQAVKNILPAMGNELVMMLKETALASTFFVGELTTAQLVIGGATFAQLEILIVTGIIYLMLTSSVGKLVSIYERRLRVSD